MTASTPTTFASRTLRMSSMSGPGQKLPRASLPRVMVMLSMVVRGYSAAMMTVFDAPRGGCALSDGTADFRRGMNIGTLRRYSAYSG